MPRYRLLIEYDGTGYAGWQRQHNGSSIQAALETAVAAFAGEAVVLQAAGRTDAGVHALGQVAHLDLAHDFPPEVVRDATNHHLRPQPIAVLAAARAPDTFHARFSAVRRDYLYRILNRRAPPALARGRVWHVRRALDAEAMQTAAQELVGNHDFTTFRAAACQAASPIKTLDRLRVRREGDAISIDASARSFLHNQVRSMVGSLVKVGEGSWRAADLRRALEARDRRACGPVAPACGLYLLGVLYGEDML